MIKMFRELYRVYHTIILWLYVHRMQIALALVILSMVLGFIGVNQLRAELCAIDG